MSNEPAKLYFKEWRKAAGLSQEALALRIGYARSSIAAAETRPYNITLAFMEALRIGVGAPSVPALFEHPDGSKAESAELLDYFADVPSRQRKLVVDMARGLAERDKTEYEHEDATSKG